MWESIGDCVGWLVPSGDCFRWMVTSHNRVDSTSKWDQRLLASAQLVDEYREKARTGTEEQQLIMFQRMLQYKQIYITLLRQQEKRKMDLHLQSIVPFFKESRFGANKREATME